MSAVSSSIELAPNCVSEIRLSPASEPPPSVLSNNNKSLSSNAISSVYVPVCSNVNC